MGSTFLRVMTPIPHLWASGHGFLHRERLQAEAAAQARSHDLPLNKAELDDQQQGLRTALVEKLRLVSDPSPLDFQVHGVVERPGYRIQKVSFLSAPGIRVTGNLYIPDGEGPFPAVLNMHGHWQQGKVAARIQARGHLLAQGGIVTLSVDAAGAGERGECACEWSYHGAMKAADLLLGGDTLLGQQIRDNRRALDVLESLPFVDAGNLGATGASGGGNQTLWLSALDERVKTAVVVASTGTFEVYVTERNCLCETLPGGLQMAEEWQVLGLVAPRPLLILNALHEKIPSFSYPHLARTCRQLQEVYALHQARTRLDWRLLDMPHGYHSEALQVMLGWMKHWLLNNPGCNPEPLPEWVEVPEDELLCYPRGQRPEVCAYQTLRTLRRRPAENFRDAERARSALAGLVGWTSCGERSGWRKKWQFPNGTEVGSVQSGRSLPIPVSLSPGGAGGELRLLLSPFGKQASFVRTHWDAAREAGVAVAAADLPGVGELGWEADMVGDSRLHDTARACLWLGYTLVAEWAEVIGCLCQAFQPLAPRIRILAEQEAVFAALLCRALCPEIRFVLEEYDCPVSAGDAGNTSMVWCVPGFLPWGDLTGLRSLAGENRHPGNP